MSSARKTRRSDARLNVSNCRQRTPSSPGVLNAPVILLHGSVTAGILVCALLASKAAFAAEEWVTVSSPSANVSFAIDKSSIKRTGHQARFWEKMTYTKPETRDEASAKLIKEKKVERLMDCEERTQAVLFGSLYAEDGSFITSTTFEHPEKTMTAIPPGSIAEGELRFVCGTPRGTLFGIDY